MDLNQQRIKKHTVIEQKSIFKYGLDYIANTL